MTKSINADLSNFKWEILTDEEHTPKGIGLIKVDDNHSILTIDVESIPNGLSIPDYIEWLESSGIIIRR